MSKSKRLSNPPEPVTPSMPPTQLLAWLKARAPASVLDSEADVLEEWSRTCQRWYEKEPHLRHIADVLVSAYELGQPPPEWTVTEIARLANQQRPPRRRGSKSGPPPRLLESQERGVAHMVEFRTLAQLRGEVLARARNQAVGVRVPRVPR